MSLSPDLAARAQDIAAMLRKLAHERRLVILCKLALVGEAKVGDLAQAVGLSQPALSQHLALMRDEGIVTARRDGQAMWYRIADPRIEEFLSALHEVFCGADKT
jgi:ArsR family transcriptional regulator